MAGDWWDSGQFTLGGGGYDPSWYTFDPGMFNLDFTAPSFDIPAFDFGTSFNLGFDPGAFSFALPDPLALPPLQGYDTPAWPTWAPPDLSLGAFGMPPAAGLTGFDLGFGGTGTPQTALPQTGLAPGSDPLTTLMGSDQGQGAPLGLADLGLGGSPGLTTGSMSPFSLFGGDTGGPTPVAGSLYGSPGLSPTRTGLTVGPLAQAQAYQEGTGTGQTDLATMLLLAKGMGGGQDSGTMGSIAKLAAAFAPTALGAAGLGLQAANRPQRNPLEDELLRARIASSGLQDTLARDRLAFERDNAAAAREAQMALQESAMGGQQAMQASLLANQQAMQDALIASRRPGGQGNINALLQGNPQLAALYQALTKQSTGLASGADNPEFNAMIEQLAQVDITELQRQAQQQIAQAQELAARQGINPANIIAEIQQRVLQESQKARANARQTLIQQMAPGQQVFNSVGSLFGNLFQTPAAQGV